MSTHSHIADRLDSSGVDRMELYQWGMNSHGPFARMTRTNPEVSTYVCICRIWVLEDCMPILLSEILHQDIVSVRLTINPLGSASRGSNPLGDDSGDLSSSSSPFVFFSVFLIPVFSMGTSFCVCQDNVTHQCHQRGNKQNQ